MIPAGLDSGISIAATASPGGGGPLRLDLRPRPRRRRRAGPWAMWARRICRAALLGGLPRPPADTGDATRVGESVGGVDEVDLGGDRRSGAAPLALLPLSTPC